MRRSKVWSALARALGAAGLTALVIAGVISRAHEPVRAQQAGQAAVSLEGVSGANVVCRPPQAPDTCFVGLGTTFTLTVNLSTAPASGYSGYQVGVESPGLSSKAIRYVAAGPPVTFPVVGLGTSSYSAGAVTAIQHTPLPTTTRTGPLIEVDLTCPAQATPFTVSLPAASTLITNANGASIPVTTTLLGDSKVAAALLVSCVGSGGIDSDGDGCPDAKELQTAAGSEMSGGRRDPNNPYDYFNPSHDHQNRVDDILLVVAHYFKDDSDSNPGQPPYAPGYNPDTDRTLLGPNAWNTGAPNGQQRVDDILAMVKQYFHDCS